MGPITPAHTRSQALLCLCAPVINSLPVVSLRCSCLPPYSVDSFRPSQAPSLPHAPLHSSSSSRNTLCKHTQIFTPSSLSSCSFNLLFFHSTLSSLSLPSVTPYTLNTHPYALLHPLCYAIRDVPLRFTPCAPLPLMFHLSYAPAVTPFT